LKLRTFRFPVDEILSVIETELDRKFYGVEFIQSDYAGLPLVEYIQTKGNDGNTKYRFLIMVGKGNSIDGLPVHLSTRLKNRLHRSIFVELTYHGNGRGVVKDCHYYDRRYRRQDIHITPPQLVSCFFPYNRAGMLNLFNHELCCDFSHIIIVTDGSIDLDANMTPLCGAV